MSQLANARAAIMTIVEQIQTDFTAYPLYIESENAAELNAATQTNPYLAVDIVMLGGEQIDMGPHPRKRQRGQIQLSAVVRAGDGTVAAAQLLDFCAPYFDLLNGSLVQCHSFNALKARTVKEWYYVPAIINFWYIWT